MLGRIVLALSFFAALTVQAADRIIPAGMTVEFPSTISIGTPPNSSNGWANVMYLNEGSTVKLVSPTSANTIYSQWVIQGNATLDISAWTSSTAPTFVGAVIILDGCTLTVKGGETAKSRSVRLGRSTANLLDFDDGQNTHYYNLNGLVLDNVDSVQFSGSGIVGSLPTDCSKISVKDGTTMAFAGEGTAALLADADGNLHSSGDVYLFGEKALPEGKGVVLDDGKNLVVKPATNDFDKSLQPQETSGAAWSPVRVVSCGKDATVTTMAGTTVAYEDNPKLWRFESKTAGLIEYHSVEPGAVVSLAGIPSATAIDGGAFLLDAQVKVGAGVDCVFTDVGDIPIVADNDLAIDLQPAARPTVYANGGTSVLCKDLSTACCGVVPYLWFDASDAASFAAIGANKDITNRQSGDYAKYDQPLFASAFDNAMLVETWFDCRDEQRTETALWQDRIYNTAAKYSAQVYPLLRTTGGPNGGSYVFFGTPGETFGGNLVDADGQYVAGFNSQMSCRLLFQKQSGTDVPKSASLTDVKTVVMVFGSQQGGGSAFLGTAKGVFGRTGTTSDDPITTNEAYAVWLNGERIVPNETKYSGGWDILSADTEGLTLASLGALDSNSNFSGQNYAEVLFFTNALTDVQRSEVERYLARKWGMESKYAVQPHTAKVMGGGGTVSVKDDLVELTGNFSGTLALDGADVRIANVRRPATAAEIAATQPLCWFDPDNEDWLVRGTDPGRLSRLRNGKSVDEDGDPVVGSSGRRAPQVVSSARGFGQERTWIDFNDPIEDFVPGKTHDNSYGNTMRIQTWPNFTGGNETGKDTPLVNVRTVVMVQDSVRGGGSPLMTGVSGKPQRKPTSASTAIWPSDAPDAMKNASLRLNGTARQSSEGFTGAPEVYSVVASADMTIGAFEYYGNSSQSTYEEQRADIEGEILVYSRELSGDALGDVEAYLMDKWLNKLPEGYADLSKATVTGSGTVSAAKWSQLPKIGVGFSGTVTATSMDVNPAFSIGADGTVVGAIHAPDATLSLPDACAATVTLPDARLAAGEYVLVDCKSWGLTEWTVTVNDPRRGRRTTSVSVADGKITLKVANSGMVILIK